jgi:hypothetical protein
MTSGHTMNPAPVPPPPSASQQTQSVGVLLATVFLGLVVTGGWLAVQWRVAAASLVEATARLRKAQADRDDLEEEIAVASKSQTPSQSQPRTQSADSVRP